MARRKKKVMRTPKAARRAARKRRSGVAERRKKQFTYRGLTVDELNELPMFAPDDDPDALSVEAIMPARGRRSMSRGYAAGITNGGSNLDEEHFINRLREKLQSCDIVQQAMLDIVKGAEGFECRSEGKFLNYVNRAVENRIRDEADHWQTQKRDIKKEVAIDGARTPQNSTPLDMPDAHDTPTPSLVAIRNEELATLERAMDLLGQQSEEYCELIIAVQIEGRTYAEIAEEVGKNMRNLEMFGLPGVKNLNLYLQKIKKSPTEKPKKIEKENKPQSKEFCPIHCGTIFLDNCKMLEALKSIKFFNVSYPLLLLPFLSRASDIVGKKIAAQYEGNNFLLNFDKTIFSKNIRNDQIITLAKEVSIEFLENNNSFSDQEWKELYKLSEETFVEETDSLKTKGAGAGLTDND